MRHKNVLYLLFQKYMKPYDLNTPTNKRYCILN